MAYPTDANCLAVTKNKNPLTLTKVNRSAERVNRVWAFEWDSPAPHSLAIHTSLSNCVRLFRKKISRSRCLFKVALPLKHSIPEQLKNLSIRPHSQLESYSTPVFCRFVRQRKHVIPFSSSKDNLFWFFFCFFNFKICKRND